MGEAGIGNKCFPLTIFKFTMQLITITLNEVLAVLCHKDNMVNTTGIETRLNHFLPADLLQT